MATSHFSDIASLIRDHPFVSCLLLLFLTPPFFRVLLYFSPLLISTALCVLALISVGPHITAIGQEVERQSNGGRLDDVGPHSRSAAASKEKPPAKLRLDWMAGLNPSGRAWVEKRLTEEGLLSDPPNRDAIISLIEAEKAAILKACDAGANGHGADALANKPAAECVEGNASATTEELPMESSELPQEPDTTVFCKIAELEEVLGGGKPICPCFLDLDSKGGPALRPSTDLQMIREMVEASRMDPTNPFSDSCQLDAMEESASWTEAAFAVKSDGGDESLLDAEM